MASGDRTPRAMKVPSRSVASCSLTMGGPAGRFLSCSRGSRGARGALYVAYALGLGGRASGCSLALMQTSRVRHPLGRPPTAIP